MANKVKQHDTLRVPQGWTGQERSLIIQLENLFFDLYRISEQLGIDLDSLREAKANKVADATDGHFASLDENGDLEDSGHKHDDYVTDVDFDALTNKLSRTKAGTSADLATVATLDGNGKVPAAQLPSYVDDVEEYADAAHFPATGEADKIYVAMDTGFTYRWSGTQYVRLNTYDEATQSNSGLMSAADKTKLDGVAEGATANIGTITSVVVNGVTVSTGGAADIGTVIREHQDISGKADKVQNGTENNFAALDANGNLKDSGHKHSDYLTQHQDISGKADKVSSATNGNFASLDASGNLKDSGHKHSDYLTSHQDISGKADKVSGATSGHLASLDASGNLQDSGHSTSEYVTDIAYDAVNKKFTKTINGNTTDIITLADLRAALGPFTHGQLAGE